MKQRIAMLKKLFDNLSSLKDDQCTKLINIYDSNINKPHEINSREIFIIGNLTLTIGWLIFNACAVMFTRYEYGLGFSEQFYTKITVSPQHAVIVSIISQSISVIVTYLFFQHFPNESGQSADLCLTVVNSSRAGMVMITGICDDCSLYAACLIGLMSGLVYLKVRQIFDRNNIDDPMQSAQIHGVCGFFGVINVAIFGKENGIMGTNANTDIIRQLGVQFLGAAVLCFWSSIVSFIFFKALSKMGHLRVGKFYEIVGIDVLTHTMSDLIGIDDNFIRDSLRYQSQQLIFDEKNLNLINYRDEIREQISKKEKEKQDLRKKEQQVDGTKSD